MNKPMRQLKITNKITNRESLSLEKYLQDISKIPMLVGDDEIKLAQRLSIWYMYCQTPPLL